eukprot:NODE_922_length_1684_cov_40.618349_g755_i0.p1 GENE.NODE_922_length_1684_cov_40.618349_g755_i0~~NODE_922_length_1684_cov_40.618349_g755_i0.p1  ORF type:complete len:415 (+),score=113.68 NODE_922_length_1684_cov_40.618349_g755_i0:79-1245(+)
MIGQKGSRVAAVEADTQTRVTIAERRSDSSLPIAVTVRGRSQESLETAKQSLLAYRQKTDENGLLCDTQGYYSKVHPITMRDVSLLIGRSGQLVQRINREHPLVRIIVDYPRRKPDAPTPEGPTQVTVQTKSSKIPEPAKVIDPAMDAIKEALKTSECRFQINRSDCSRIIGLNGQAVRALERKTLTNIHIQDPEGGDATMAEVLIHGSDEQIEEAKKEIQEIIDSAPPRRTWPGGPRSPTRGKDNGKEGEGSSPPTAAAPAPASAWANIVKTGKPQSPESSPSTSNAPAFRSSPAAPAAKPAAAPAPRQSSAPSPTQPASTSPAPSPTQQASAPAPAPSSAASAAPSAAAPPPPQGVWGKSKTDDAWAKVREPPGSKKAASPAPEEK